MSAEEILKKYEAHTQHWLENLNEYTEENFIRKPTANEWSISQVYSHIAEVTDKCVSNALLCAQNKGETGHAGIGPAIFSWMGSFPPVKMKIKKIPEGMETIYQPKEIDKQEAKNMLEAVLEKMKSAMEKIKSADRNQRIEHWAGGWFNALQWFQSAEMHIRHHLRQKRRIDSFLKT
jgi:hypothetical protein